MSDSDQIPSVLVVDDEPNIRELVQVALQFHGCAVTTAATGKDALRQAETDRPDLIVLDVMLPDINGQAVCELIRQDPTMSDIKIICISGMVEEDKIAELREAGADDFLQKPLDIDELIRRVCRLLDIETGPTG